MTTFSLYDGSGADPLAQAVLAAGSGIIVARSSAVYTGADSATSFADMTDLGAGVGVLLTSGTGAPPTHNTSGSYSVANYTAGAPELTAVAHAAFGGAGDSHDAAILSFDFEVSDPTATSITFKMLFGSDEYPEWSNTSYVDAAAVFVNGTNVALFDNDPTKPLSVIGANFPYIQDNTDGHIALEYDGISLPLSITAPAVKGLNHIEIAVSDTGDYIYDTGLLVYGMHAVSGGTTGVSNQVDGTGKNDDLDYSGSKLDQTFDLGGGDDSLKIGSGNNTVYAGDGNDSVYMPGGNAKNYIDGGDGYDTVYYSKASTGTTIVTNKDGTVTVGDPDILKNVEAIHFTDKTIIVADLFTPVTHLATTGYSAGTAGNDKVLVTDKAEFAAAVDRVSTISSERGRAVKLSVADRKLTLSVTNPDSGSATEEIEVDYDSTPLEIGFNARYLLDITNQLDSDTAFFKLSDSGSPTVIQDRDGSNALYVLMPMRV